MERPIRRLQSIIDSLKSEIKQLKVEIHNREVYLEDEKSRLSEKEVFLKEYGQAARLLNIFSEPEMENEYSQQPHLEAAQAATAEGAALLFLRENHRTRDAGRVEVCRRI